MEITIFLNMPKPDPVTGRDSLGIPYEGPILTGILGVAPQLERQAVSSAQTSAQIREIASGGLTYETPSYRIHTFQGNPIEPDPLYAQQRSELPHPCAAGPRKPSKN